MIEKAACFSFSLSAHEPMAYLRLTGPLQQAGIALINGYEDNHTNAEAVHEGDIVIFQREFPTRFEDYQQISALARREGKPIFFEIDDLLFFMPDMHPDRQRKYYGPTLLPMLQALIEADLITVTTPKLREVLLDYNPNIVVIPNYFDDQLWKLTPPTRKTTPDVLTIGYMGTTSHKPDLAYLTPVLVALLETYPEKIRLHFWGAEPPPEISAFPQVEWTSEFFASYREFAAFFQTQTADIFIAPLTANLFNQCKSAIKFFEYSALGVPGVYSHLDPYANVITHAHDGLLAASLEEWRANLKRLIEDDELRFQLALNAQKTIRDKWLLSQNAARWQETYQTAMGRSSDTDFPYMDMFASINQQLFDTFTEKAAIEKSLRTQLAEQIAENARTVHKMNVLLAQRDHNIRVLNAHLTQAREEIEQLNAEILGYVLSKSWRMTRPMRVLEKRLKHILGKANA